MNLKFNTIAKLRTVCQAISIVLLVTVFSTSCQQSNARITDKNFEQALMDVLSQTDSPLTRSDLARLEELNLSNMEIENLNGLQYCTNLTELSLTGNHHIEDLGPLSSLINLNYLTLMNNKVRNLEPLQGLTKLIGLGLQANDIQDIRPLSSLVNLTSVTLDMNNISDIGVLENLTNLRFLSLSYNQITDISPLVNNTGLGQGDEVRLEENPLSEVSINIHIPALQAKGVIVSY